MSAVADEVLQAVQENVAVVLGLDPGEVSPELDLESFDIDSLELMEIGTRLESALGMRIEPDDLVGLCRVADIADSLRRARERV